MDQTLAAVQQRVHARRVQVLGIQVESLADQPQEHSYKRIGKSHLINTATA